MLSSHYSKHFTHVPDIDSKDRNWRWTAPGWNRRGKSPQCRGSPESPPNLRPSTGRAWQTIRADRHRTAASAGPGPPSAWCLPGSRPVCVGCWWSHSYPLGRSLCSSGKRGEMDITRKEQKRSNCFCHSLPDGTATLGAYGSTLPVAFPSRTDGSSRRFWDRSWSLHNGASPTPALSWRMSHAPVTLCRPPPARGPSAGCDRGQFLQNTGTGLRSFSSTARTHMPRWLTKHPEVHRCWRTKRTARYQHYLCGRCHSHLFWVIGRKCSARPKNVNNSRRPTHTHTRQLAATALNIVSNDDWTCRLGLGTEKQLFIR